MYFVCKREENDWKGKKLDVMKSNMKRAGTSEKNARDRVEVEDKCDQIQVVGRESKGEEEYIIL